MARCRISSVSGKVVLELQNECLSVWQFVHFPEVALAVDFFKVTFTLELEEICLHFCQGHVGTSCGRSVCIR